MTFLATYWWVFLILSFLFTLLGVVLFLRQFKKEWKRDAEQTVREMRIMGQFGFESILSRFLPIILCVLADSACVILFLIGVIAALMG